MAGLSNKPDTLYISGAMSGIGRALAGAYLQRGARVAIFDLRIDEGVLQELDKLRQSGAQQLVAHAADVTDFQALQAAVEQAAQAIGEPALAIRCAGIQRARPFEPLSHEDFEQVVQVNLFGSRKFSAALLPRMQRGSRLALVSSLAGFTANYSYAAYSASKFAVVGLAKVLRLEYKPRGIGVSLICPPEVDTPMVLAEQKNMHPASRELKGFGGSLTLEAALAGILAGLDAGRELIIPGRKARLSYFCNRYLPDFIVNGLVDRVVASALAKTAAGKPTASRPP